MKRQCFFTIALLVVVFSACALPQAMAEYEYFDNFNTQLDPFWWTMSSSGSVTASYATDITNPSNKLILMRYLPGPEGYFLGEGKLTLNFPMQGDFSASIKYNLFNWPVPDNDVTIGIRTGLGDVERLSNGTEFYLTDFIGDSTYSVGTDDMKGRIRIQRVGSALLGYWYMEDGDDNPWQLIRQYNSTSKDDTSITISLWPGVSANQNVAVTFDDFNLHALDAADPRGVAPEPASMLLFTVGAAAMAVIKRSKKKSI